MVVVAAVVGFVVLNRDDSVDATTSDAPVPTVGDDRPVHFEKPLWRKPLARGAQVAADGAYVAVRERTGVRVYDAGTGDERWHHLDRNRVTTDIVVWWRQLAVVSKKNVEVFDLETGEQVASVPADGARTAVPLGDSFLVVPEGAGEYRLYRQSGEERWAHATPKCATSSQVYVSGLDIAIASDCGDKTLVEGIEADGEADWQEEVPGGKPLASGPVLLAEDAPVLLTKDDQVVPYALLGGFPLEQAPAGDGLTSVRDGWCAYAPTPEPSVQCQNARTGEPIEQPYLLGETAKVHIFAAENNIQIASTTDTSLSVGVLGSKPVPVVSNVEQPAAVYYGKGALVVTTKDEILAYY